MASLRAVGGLLGPAHNFDKVRLQNRQGGFTSIHSKRMMAYKQMKKVPVPVLNWKEKK